MGPNLTPAEGMILGTAAKMFTIAGPVIVHGISDAVDYGLICWIMLVLQCKKLSYHVAKPTRW